MPHAYLGAPQIRVIQRCRKVPFATQEIALRKMRRMSGNPRPEVESTQGRLNLYQCLTCPGVWHIGHILGRPSRDVDGGEQCAD